MRRRRLSYSQDARHDMEERGVTRADVQNALANERTEQAGDNRWRPTVVITGPSMHGRLLCVVLDEEARDRVVSVFWPYD